MAMSKISTKVNLDVLTCALCSGLYKSPKILPCLHTFCEPCLNDFIVSLGKRKWDKIVDFSCPLCRTCTKPANPDGSYDQWAADLPENIGMKLMIARASDEDFPNCDVCSVDGGKSVSKYWCGTCKNLLCETCYSYHQKFGMSKNHRTESLDKIGTNRGGFYVHAILTTCPNHPIHTIDFYCSAHECFGCCNCKELKHGKCKITPIKEMSDFCQNIPEKLCTLRETFLDFLVKKRAQKEDLKTEVKKIENEAIEFVERVKEKLDNLLENFKKQLTIFHEEENTKFNIRSRLLEQAMTDINHWIDTIGIVKDTGTDEQLVIQTDVMKHQVKATMEELFENLKLDVVIKLRFDKDAAMTHLESLERIGSFVQSSEVVNGEVGQFFAEYLPLGIELKCVDLEYVKYIKKNSYNIRCGVCRDGSSLLISSKGGMIRLYIVMEDDCSVKSNSSIHCERMFYHSLSRKLFTSDNGSTVLIHSLNENVINTGARTFNCNSSHTGAMDYFKGHVYVATGGTIKRFDPNNTSKMIEECCPTITNASAMGLKIFNRDVIFFTKDNNVKRCSLDGKEIFSYSSPDITSPVSLIVLPITGHILLLDSTDGGKLHLLSADGNRHMTILDTFKQVREPTDIWLGVNNDEIYISGGEYIEIYKLV